MNPFNIPEDLFDKLNEIDSMLIELSEKLDDIWRDCDDINDWDEYVTEAKYHVDQAQYMTAQCLDLANEEDEGEDHE